MSDGCGPIGNKYHRGGEAIRCAKEGLRSNFLDKSSKVLDGFSKAYWVLYTVLVTRY